MEASFQFRPRAPTNFNNTVAYLIYMAATETVLSIAAMAIAAYLGIKILKNILVTAIMIVILAAILYYLGYIPPIFGAIPKII